MHLPDVNVWIALAFPVHVHHTSARAWFSALVGPCHFCRFTQLGFLRIANNPRAMHQAAVSLDEAWKLFDHFLAHPNVRFADEPAGVESPWRQIAQGSRHSPNLWGDAYLAAIAVAGGFEVVTFDQGFSQFSQLKVNILT